MVKEFNLSDITLGICSALLLFRLQPLIPESDAKSQIEMTVVRISSFLIIAITGHPPVRRPVSVVSAVARPLGQREFSFRLDRHLKYGPSVVPPSAAYAAAADRSKRRRCRERGSSTLEPNLEVSAFLRLPSCRLRGHPSAQAAERASGRRRSCRFPTDTILSPRMEGKREEGARSPPANAPGLSSLSPLSSPPLLLSFA